MENFKGDFAFIHRWEGYVGHPYFPGTADKPGFSGVTLDTGVDLGHVDKALFERVFFPHIPSLPQRELLRGAYGLKGAAAYNYFQKYRTSLKAIKISKEVARIGFEAVVVPYWNETRRKYPGIDDAPSQVQTALLSLGYNRGVWNKATNFLIDIVKRKDWRKLGTELSKMQQDHAMRGVRLRRVAEGQLVLGIK